ncbi:MAG: hypothetical protein QMB52_11560 [Propionivibrio sp.]
MTSIVATVTKEGATAEEIEAVVLLLKKGLPVERGMVGILVGNTDQETTPLAINLVGKALTLAVRVQHGETGLIVAAAVAAMLKQDLVGANSEVLAPTSATVIRLNGQPLSEKGIELAEKLGVILPRVRSAKVFVPF